MPPAVTNSLLVLNDGTVFQGRAAAGAAWWRRCMSSG